MPGVRPALLHAGPAAPPLPGLHHELRGDGVVVVEGGAVPRLGVGLDGRMVGVAGKHEHAVAGECLTSQYITWSEVTRSL